MAGRIQLATTGIQDQWLTGDPQFSYFVTIFKRHTRFSTEAVEIPFSGDIGLGKSIQCRIPNNIGDLLRSVILKVTLGNLTANDTSGSTDQYYLYNPSLGKDIIKHADLLIGGQLIERITGDYINMYDQIYSNKDDVEQTLYFLNGHGNHLTVSDTYNTFYVNLPFYFFRNPSLAIPVCAITKQLVEVRLTFKNVDDDITFNYSIPTDGTVRREKTTEGSIVNASLITDYYFITDDEKNYLSTRPMEYVITQLQKSTISFKPADMSKSALLKFKNPVKELFFIAKETTSPISGQVYDLLLDTNSEDQSFSSIVIGNGTKYKRSDHRAIKRIKFTCNGSTVFNKTGTELAYHQSLKFHTGCPDPAYEFYMYSFSLKPEKYYPTGQLNMSRISHKHINIELEDISSTRDINVDVYALNYNVLRVQSGLAGLKF